MALIDVLQNQNKIAVSTAARVLVDGNFIGVIQTLDPSQTRNTTAVRGIGIGDRQISRIWNLTEYTLNVQKMALFKKAIINLFGYGDTFRMLAQLRTPIDIHEILLSPETGQPLRQTIYRGCYMNQYGSPKNIGEVIITESATFDVTSVDDGENSPFDYDVGIS